MKKLLLALGLIVVFAAVAGGVVIFTSREQATVAIDQGYGPKPVLPEPNPKLIPTVNIAEAGSWPQGGKPAVASGMAVTEFAGGLDHPRTVHPLPNGDVLVAETNAPPKPEDGNNPKGWIMRLVMGKAGAGVPSPNKIVLLRDKDGDGVAETRSDYIEGLNSPFGMVLVGDKLYVANTDSVVAFPYVEGATEITAAPEKIADLPGGPGSSRSTSRPGNPAPMRQAFATRTARHSIRRAARYGSPSTSATRSAATSCRTT